MSASLSNVRPIGDSGFVIASEMSRMKDRRAVIRVIHSFSRYGCGAQERSSRGMSWPLIRLTPRLTICSAKLNPGKLTAVVHLLEVMMRDEEEPVSEEDRRRFREGQAWFARRGGKGVPMEDVLAEFGVKPEDFPLAGVLPY